MKRWKTFWKNSDGEARFRLFALLAFPMWVLSLPICRFAIAPWLLGLLAPFPLMSAFQRYPRMPVLLIVAGLLSCQVLFALDLPGLQATLACCWAWFWLGFGAGLQWWSLSAD